MRKLLNTLYITSPDSYLSKDGTNVVITIGDTEVGRIPIHNIEGIVMFGRLGASPYLMKLCMDNGTSLSFVTPTGRLIASVQGFTKGNVLLRREQYRIADDPSRSIPIAKNMIIGKISNCRSILRKTKNNHGEKIGEEILEGTINHLSDSLKNVMTCEDRSSLRGIEGDAARSYFDIFDDLILKNKDEFCFRTRNRRPPRDKVNAMLSFLYSMLMNDVKSALETVGLDPYVGFMHTDRPGRPSLALDLMEELRPLVDRTVLRMINLRIVNSKDFLESEDGSVYMNDDLRKTIIEAWQTAKNEEIYHPFLDEKIKQGLLPYVQSMLLAKYIRKEIDGYPPYIIGAKK